MLSTPVFDASQGSLSLGLSLSLIVVTQQDVSSCLWGKVQADSAWVSTGWFRRSFRVAILPEGHSQPATATDLEASALRGIPQSNSQSELGLKSIVCPVWEYVPCFMESCKAFLGTFCNLYRIMHSWCVPGWDYESPKQE